MEKLIALGARLLKPLHDLWRSEPVLTIAGILIGGSAALEAANNGLTIEAIIQIGIEAAIAFFIRHQVWSPASVEKLAQTED